jgi:hypothetical protein
LLICFLFFWIVLIFDISCLISDLLVQITVKVFDKDSNYALTDFSRHTLCGEVSFNLSSLMCSNGQKLTLDLKNGRSKGTVSIQAEAVANTRDVFVTNFSGSKLVNKDGFFGKSDPFYKIYRLYESGSWGLAYKSPTIMNNLNPVWPRTAFPLVSICNGDLDRPIKIEIWDEDSNGKHDFMGEVETSVRGLMQGGASGLDVIEKDVKAKKKGYVNSGKLHCNNAVIEHHPTLVEVTKAIC